MTIEILIEHQPYFETDIRRRINHLVVIERLSHSRLRCRCDCGNERIVRVGHFNSGTVISCGCVDRRRSAGPKPACIVEGCQSIQCNGHGWCWKHYTRWRRHGDPLAIMREDLEAWLIAHVAYEGDDCLIWPFGRSDHGYGSHVGFDGIREAPHRAMCRLVNGPPPSKRHQAAHSCGKGCDGCVHPLHLRWATPKENSADQVLHGTARRGTKNHFTLLTEEDVKEIRRAYGALEGSYREIGSRFGVTAGAISSVICGKSWGWLE